ncbi:MAG: hypothetical protein ACI9W4_000557 [Rhodothermales bacterium]|jgi:hypothetical protein
MQSNRLVPLVGVLVLLLGIAYFAGVFNSELSTISVPTVDVPVEDVSSLRIQTNSWEADLTREGGLWQVAEPAGSPADSNTVSRLLDSIAELELNSIVSTNPERHAQYGVDQESGRYVTLSWGGEEVTLILAAQGPDFSSSYVRLGESAEVYSASRVTLPTSRDQLRDKTLINVPGDQVRSASVTTEEYAYRLAYQNGWTIAGEGSAAVAADSVKVTSWLRRYAPLRFDGFEDGLTSDSVSVTVTVELTMASGQTRRVLMGTRDTDLLAFTSSSSAVMRAAATRLATLIEDPAVLKGDG